MKSKSAVIGMLQDLQKKHNYLPKKELVGISKKLDMPLSQVYSLATFYKAFSLKPRGKYQVSLCMGTACHVRGGEAILGELEKKLEIKSGETAKDGSFSLEAVNCLGACALGPLMMINNEYYGKMTVDKVGTVLKNYEKK